MIRGVGIGVIGDELDQNLERALAECTRLGLNEVELRTIEGRSVVDLPRGELDAAMREARRRGITVTAFATPIFKCALHEHEGVAIGAVHGARPDAQLDEHWEILERAAGLASAHGVPFIRVFSFWRVPSPEEVRDEVVEILAEARRRIEGYPVELLLENEHDCNVATAAETEAVLDELPGLRVIWDPGNHVRAGGDPADAVPARFGRRVAHVHLKDIDENGRWVPLGEGVIPFEAVLGRLEEDGFGGALSLETHCQVDGSTVRATERSLSALRDLLDRYLVIEAVP